MGEQARALPEHRFGGQNYSVHNIGQGWVLSALVTQANGYQNRQISAKCFRELASYSNNRGCRGQTNFRPPELASGHGPTMVCKGLPRASTCLVSDLEPKNCCTSCCICQLHSVTLPRHLGLQRTAKGWDQDCRPINESFSHPGMLRCQTGTWTYMLVSAQICLNAKPGCFLPTRRKFEAVTSATGKDGKKTSDSNTRPSWTKSLRKLPAWEGHVLHVTHDRNLVLPKNKDSDSGISSDISPFQGHLLGKQGLIGNIRERKQEQKWEKTHPHNTCRYRDKAHLCKHTLSLFHTLKMGKGYIQKNNFLLKIWNIIYCGFFFSGFQGCSLEVPGL